MNAAAAGGPAVAAFPWDDLLRVAVLRLGLAPADFWRLSMRELTVLLTPPARPEPAAMTRARLARLMETYPDG